MKNFSRIAACVICIAGCSFFLGSCSTPAGKTEHQSYTVTIQSMEFQPVELSVQKGDTVVFINKDILVHDVTEEKRKAWSSAPLATGQTYKMVVLENADYFCSIHPVMRGKLRIQ